MAEVRDYTKYLIYLCRCAVAGETPKDGFPEGLDFEKFFRFCYDHQLVGLAYDMISGIKTGYEDTDIMLIFKDKHNYAVLKDASQDYYLGLIREAFAENGIDHAPLKGSIIKDIYPIPYYRQSADIDILIRREDAAKAKDVMEGLGFTYKNEFFGNPYNTDNYRIDKFGYVELHKILIVPEHKQLQSCNEIINRLNLKDNHEYEMSVEDFYIFMIVHAAKHMKRSAIGIRAVLDIHVYRSKYNEMDEAYIDSELKKMRVM